MVLLRGGKAQIDKHKARERALRTTKRIGWYIYYVLCAFYLGRFVLCASRDPGIVEGRDGRPLQPRRIVVVIVLRAHVVCGDQVVAAAAAVPAAAAAAPVVIASATIASRAPETDSRGRVAGFPGRVFN